MGIHRFYLKSALGLVFVALFGVNLYCNAQVRDLREDVSRTRSEVDSAHNAAERARNRAARQPGAETAARLKTAEATLGARERAFKTALAVHGQWNGYARWTALTIAGLLLIDAALIPGAVRRRRARAPTSAPAAVVEPVEVAEIGTGADPSRALHTRLTDGLEWVNTRTGEFVAYWALIAVMAYYYEVVARYVFNSPTNWVHESMFLMFGMQYMLSGAYAYREDQHVRVDILYTRFSTRGKAIADIVTSVFFFIFTGTMLWTGIRFAADAVHVGERSFTEWAVQYWPVKIALPLGAALIVLQGLSKLVKDILIVARRAD